MDYRGRFAPSPTGALHFGSLVTALASWLDARAASGRWLVRIEDLDTARKRPGAADDVLRTLDAFGLHWDESVLRQSDRIAYYETALDRLRADGHAFGCACTRSEIAAGGRQGIDGAVYPGTCRKGVPAGRRVRAWRVRVDDRPIAFTDRIQGPVVQGLADAVGDFVVRRADGVFAYQLAVVVDDAAQGITDIVRGADLLDSSPRQRWLQHLLGLPQPRLAHLPVAVDADGRKLSKQTLATAIDRRDAPGALRRALAFLGQPVPPGGSAGSAAEVLAFALSQWDTDRIPRVTTQAATAPSTAGQSPAIRPSR